MKTTIYSSLMILAAFAWNGCQDAGEGNEVSTDSSAAINRAPDNATADRSMEEAREFITEAATGGMMEVELGEMAQQKAVSQRVKDFGAMMVRDHSKANEELKSIASQKNIPVPDDMEENQQRQKENLNGKQGTGFDEAYMKMMVDDHEKDIRKFEKMADNSNNPELKAFAQKNLPVLRAHLDSAKAIRKMQ